jgi:hypothetical protein
MSLRDTFTSNTTLLVRAIKGNDVALLRRLQKKKDGWFALYVGRLHMGGLTPEVAELFVNGFTERDWQRWGFRQGCRNEILDRMACEAFFAGRAELTDLYLTAVDFNCGKAADHAIHFVVRGKLSDEAKTDCVRRLLKAGIDKVKDADAFVADAAQGSSDGAFDLLAAARNADIHRNNEELLRTAAGAQQRGLCRHLVEKHGADINLAVTTARTLANQNVWTFLEELRAELRPGESAPPTIESLAAEVKALKAAVSELTARVVAQDAVRTLDKPPAGLAAAKPDGKP